MMAYHKTEYLERLAWPDGKAAYCRRCDASVPLHIAGKSLVCDAGHYQHPVNVIVSGVASR